MWWKADGLANTEAAPCPNWKIPSGTTRHVGIILLQRFFSFEGFDSHYFFTGVSRFLQAESDCLKDENCTAFTASTSEATVASIVSIYR